MRVDKNGDPVVTPRREVVTGREARKSCPKCGGDAGDNWFDRSLCPCDDVMHTRCCNCGAALDGCSFDRVSREARKSFRCKLGIHKPTHVRMRTELHMGVFGGPLTTFYWTCARCGERGTT